MARILCKKTSHAPVKKEKVKLGKLREKGLSPRQLGISPRQLGISPRQLGVSVKQRGLSPRQLLKAAEEKGITVEAYVRDFILNQAPQA